MTWVGRYDFGVTQLSQVWYRNKALKWRNSLLQGVTPAGIDFTHTPR